MPSHSLGRSVRIHRGRDNTWRVMFENLHLFGMRQRKIVLQTRLGRPIENAQTAEPDEQDIRIFQLILANHEWMLRKRPCGIYNCFGLIWAARRTGIYDLKGVETILQDDGYRILSAGEKPLYGDIALYFFPPPGAEIWHAGLVCELREFVKLEISPVPWVLSKLGPVYGEVLHKAEDVHSPQEDCYLEYWTDRPMGEE